MIPPPPFNCPNNDPIPRDSAGNSLWPDPIVEPDFNYNLEFCEETTGQESPWDSAMSGDAASVTSVGVVSWRRLYAAIQFFIGVNWVDYSLTQAVVPILRRLPPHRHPLFPWLHCTKITSMKAFAGTRRTWDDLVNNHPTGPSDYKYISNMPEFNPRLSPAGFRPGDNFGTYDKVRLTLQYEPLTYQIRPDDFSAFSIAGNDESRRHVTPFAEVQNIVLTIEGGNFIWYQGPDSGFAGEGGSLLSPNPRPVNAKLNKIIETQGIRFMWHRVPREWVEDANRVLRTFGYLQGMVNKTAFMGFPPQTLRLLPPKKGPLRVEPCWVRNAPYLQYSFDLEIAMQYFNPTHGLAKYSDPQPDGSSPVTASPLLGHNLAISGTNFLYFGIAHRSTPPPAVPKPFNDMTDLAAIWQHWCGA